MHKWFDFVPNSVQDEVMDLNRTGYTRLDEAVSEEVRALIARTKGVSVKSIAEELGIRRATLSSRVNGHAAFAPSLLAAVAERLGTTASEIVARAERALGMAVAS